MAGKAQPGRYEVTSSAGLVARDADGKVLIGNPGQVVELTAEQAEHFLRHNAVKQPGGKRAPKPEPAPEPVESSSPDEE